MEVEEALGNSVDSKCPMCLDTNMDDPRLLPCLHTFCSKCIDQMAVTAGGGGESLDIRCPVCRAICTLPLEGAVGLPVDSTLLRLRTRKLPLRQPSCGAARPDEINSGHQLCPDHGHRLMYFCERCEAPVCKACTSIGDHIGHRSVPYDKPAIKRHRQKILAHVDRVREDLLPRLDLSLQSIDDVSVSLSANTQRVKGEIRAAKERAIAAAEAMEIQLLTELEDQENERQKLLEGQREELTAGKNALQNALAFSDRLRQLESDADEHQTRLMAALETRLTALGEHSRVDLLPREHPRLLLRPISDQQLAKNTRANAGELVLGHAAAKQCSVIDHQAAQHVLQDCEAGYTLEARNDAGARLDKGGDLVRAEWLRLPNRCDAEPDLHVNDSGTGIYALSCRPQHRGEYKMAIIVNGERLDHSLVFTYGSTFDPNECHRQLVLEEDECRVTKAGDNSGYSSVLGRLLMQYGRHHWTVRIGAGCWYAIGVASKPLQNNTYNISQANCWTSQKYVYSFGNVPGPSSLSPWEEGDVFDIAMDISRGRLTITNRRNGENDAIANLWKGPYYPYFNMKTPGSSIELL